MLQIYYSAQNQYQYSFQQRTLDYWNGYDNEDLEGEYIQLQGGLVGIIYAKNNQTYLLWQQEGYVFEIVGNLKKEDMKKLAASVEPTED